MRRTATTTMTLVLALARAAAGQTSPTPTQPSDTAEKASPAEKLPATVTPAAADQTVAIHMQMTETVQGTPPFHAAFSGANSLRPRGDTQETFDYTVYVGAKLWRGAEAWINPEVDQGFGLAGTLGAAGFPSAEAYKVGKREPYLKLHRLFVRQTIDLGGEAEAIAPDLNVLDGRRTRDRIVLTVGKFGVGDVFDTNAYAHDARNDFLNWTVVDGGAFDYAADSWGYTAGVAGELYKGRFTARAGFFDLSKVPNGEGIEPDFRQYQAVGELEERHHLFGRAGKIALTGWFSHASMGRYTDALAAAAGGVPSTANVRRFATRFGLTANIEQAVTPTLGLFARAGFADGRYETYEFTDADRSFSAGVSLGGKGWHRVDDRVGLAFVLNQASPQLKAYLAAGGLGPLIGDGALPRPGDERIVEAYYRLTASKYLHVSFDTQLIDPPAYNRDRGPVVVLGGRVHGQF